MDSSWISSNGEFITKFEDLFAKQVGARHGIACCNGTVALHSALLAAGVEPGDEVMVPALTYIATANAVRYCNATPVLVDADPGTWNLDPNQLEDLVTTRTRAIIPVHIYGHPTDMGPIREIASRHGLVVIEDAAEAHGATYHGQGIGSLGDLATFSFYGNKIITCGEGGMVTTSSAEIADRVRLLRGQGMDPVRRYWHPIVGYNYRMTNLAAAIGLAQTEQIDWHLARRREVAEWYHRHLADLEDLIQLPVEMPWARHAYWMYSVIVRDADRAARDTLMARLLADGIETRPFFYSLQELPPYADATGTFEVATRLSGQGISLPTHAGLNEEDVAYVCSRLRVFCQQRVTGLLVAAAN